MTKDEILQKVKYETQIRGLSKNTQERYYTTAKHFQDYYGKPATELDITDIKNYLYYLLTEKGLAPSSINAYNSGLRFLYNVTLNNPVNGSQIPCHHKRRRFPEILSRNEVADLFAACDNLRDKCILMTAYGAGLRVSEVSSLKVGDIDSKNMQIFVRNAKGGKDRFAILSKANLGILREYYRKYRPKEWLFYSRNRTGTHITSRATQNIFNKYKDISGITKKVSTHTLRHSFATHLLEDGVSIYHIKQLLGHSDISTTCFYLHIVNISDLKVASPLDTLLERSAENA
jgi:site-specific recombinase XerD